MTSSDHRQRLWRITSMAFAAAAAILLLADGIAENPALFLGGLALLGAGVTIFFLAALAAIPASGDFWDTFPWGKLFVGLVYASITAFVFLAFLRTARL